MPLSALHIIELQLIMHQCDKAAILKLARCSRTLLAAASCAFAFRCVSPVPVPLRAGMAALVAQSLLRFCELSLCEEPAQPSSVLSKDTNARLLRARILSFPRVSRLQLISDLPAPEWALLLRDPKLRGLSSLTTPSPSLQEPQVHLLRQYQASLHTLRFSSTTSSAVGALLCKLPSLTDLAVRIVPDSPSEIARPIRLMSMDQLSRCKGIRRLTLTSWITSALNSLMDCVAFHTQLEDLCFVKITFMWSRSYASLSSLRRLLIDDCALFLNFLQSAVTDCPGLERIVVRPRPSLWERNWPDAAWIERYALEPRRKMLAAGAGVAAAPLVFQLWVFGPEMCSNADRPLGVASVARLRTHYAALLTPSAASDPAMRFELLDYRSRAHWGAPLMDA